MRRLTLEPGSKFHRWIVVGPADGPVHLKRKAAYFTCQCECGAVKVLDGAALVRGDTKSCGCLRRENSGQRTHGLFRTPLYNTYHQMLQRCYNVDSENYPTWGGRGIAVCEEWRSDVLAFVRWAQLSGWQEGLTLERKDNDGPYSPDNCVWATKKQQANNTRNNVMVKIDGQTMTLKQAAERLAVVYQSLHYLHRKKGLELEEAARLARRASRSSNTPG